MNNLTEDQKKMLKNMGALGYPAKKISNIMKLDVSFLESQLSNQNSEIFKIYNEGADYASYIIDLKLFEMAQSGDIKAIEKMEKRRKEVNTDISVSDISVWGV